MAKTQLELQKELNNAVGARTALLREQDALVKSQLANVLGLKKAWQETTPNVNDILSGIKKTHESLQEMSEEFEQFGATGKLSATGVARAMQQSGTAAGALNIALRQMKKEFPILIGFAAGFVDGLVSGFKFVYNVFDKTLDLLMSIGKGITDVTMSLIAMPFRSLEALISIANKLIPLMEAVARATEDVRKQFGDLGRTASYDVMKSARDLGKGFESMGLSGYSVFGSLDERITAVRELATAMGASFEQFGAEITASRGAVMLMQKGLGHSNETMKGIAIQAKALGTSFTTQLTKVARLSIDFSKRFGIAQKLISRDVGEMQNDVANFGTLAPVELTKISVYARKLGVEFKDLVGVIEKFDTFESAAESTAMLSQAFGAQADAIKLMKAENPAERVDELRRAFLATGQSADMLTRQERKLLAQTTGLNEQSVLAAFSQKNLGVTMADLEKQGKVSEKQQLSAAEAVGELKDSIERMIKPFKVFTGFLAAFRDGFARGLFATNDTRAALEKLYNALHHTYVIGMRVGEAFGKMFAGLQPLIKAFGQFFDTSKRAGGTLSPFMKMLEKVRTSFEYFFTTIEYGPAAVGILLQDLKDAFKELEAGFNGSIVSSNAMSFTKAVGNVFAGLAHEAAKGVLEIIAVLKNFFTGGSLPNIPGQGLAKNLFQPVIDEFNSPTGPIKQLVPAFVDLIKSVWDKHGQKVKDALEPLIFKIGAFIVGTALIKGILSGIGVALGMAFVGGISKWVAAGGIGKLGATLSLIGSGIVELVTAPIVAIPAIVALAVGGAKNGLDKFESNLQKNFGTTEAKVGAFAAGIADILTFGLVPDIALEQVGSWFAGLSEYMLDAMTNLFPGGGILAKFWRDAVNTIIDTLKSLGDLIAAVFSGDSDEITKTATDFGGRIVKALLVAFIELPILLKATVLSALGWLGFELIKGLGWLTAKVFEWSAIIIGRLGQVVLGLLAGVFEQIANMFDPKGNAASAIAYWFFYTFKAVLKHASTFVGDLMTGMKQGLTGLPVVMRDLFERAWQSVKDFFGISSPSRVAAELGGYIISGLRNGINSLGNGMFDGVKSAVSHGLDAVTGMFDTSNVTSAFRDFTSPAVEAVKGMIEEANAINDALSDISAINIDARLKQLGDRLGIDNEKLKIKQGRVEMHVTFNVTVEADKLVSVLSEHGVVVTNKGA